MGMFDWIKVEPEQFCRECEAPLSGWQSKDGDCILETLNYWEVDCFYTCCDECHAWHEFSLKYPRDHHPLSDYELKVRERLW